jgi:DNA repair protein RecN (Recombination protein N)
MLLELRAENYAVIDHAVAELGPGLNLLTGETGAGKSILVDALALLMGGKGSADVVRHGADKAVLSCVFESTPEAEAILDANGLDAEGMEILLRREINRTGKGRVFVNNQPATAAVLRQLAPELALIHAQSETLAGFDPAQQRLLLDRYAALSLEPVASAYARWRQTADRLRALESDEQDRLRLADLLSFQANEIGAASLTAGEDETLEAERRVLQNSEKLYAAAMSAYDHLYESSASAETALLAGLRQVEELARFDPRFTEAAQQLASARAVVDDIAETVRDFAEGMDASPERLAEIEDRLALIDRLKRKYGVTLPAVIAYGDEVAGRLAEIENRDALLDELRRDLAQHAAAYRQAAAALTAQRQHAAARLAKVAESQINDLAMRVRFSVDVTPHEDPARWAAHGWDEVLCRIATNAGEPLKPLDQIASGGEMSRVLLALKVSVEEGAAKAAGARRKTLLPRTLVFDEIDIGIGGRAAEAVGQKLRALSRAQQVLCVTHLPQIAAFADQHFLVEKRETKGRTSTAIRRLDSQERSEEIARMLSGAKLTDTSRRHAEQMLKEAAVQ